MASRMNQTVVRRPSLPLTPADEADLALLKQAAAYQRALARLSSQDIPPGAEVTESVLLHAVFEAGLAAVRQLAEADGYEQMAADSAADDATRRRLSRRRRPSWAAET
jgi:hypothetical protein